VVITTQAGPLAAALSLAAMAAATSTKNKSDPLVHVTAERGDVSFTCSGPGIMIRAVAEADIPEPGTVAVSAKRLDGLLSGFSSSTTISFKYAANALTITGGGARYRLPVDPYPPDLLTIKDEIAAISISGTDLLALLDVLPAVDTEQTRFYLTGIRLHNIGDRLFADATNGEKLLRANVVAEHFSTDPRLIVPGKAAALLQRLIKSTKAPQVTLRRSRTLIAVTAPKFEFISRLIDYAYPDLNHVLPATSANFLTCAPADLTAALIRLAAVANGELPLVALFWVDGEPLRLFLPRQPNDAADFIAAETKGTARILVSLPLLTAMVANFNGARIELAVNGDGPLALRGGGGKLGVVMGCRWTFGEMTAPHSRECSP
jgi:DNA polymerase-3 subunit beta